MTLPELAFGDDLTGVYNRRYLNRLLAERWSELAAGREVAILIVDLDAFKAINDSHGHLTGDEALRATARVLSEHFRSDDIIARYGGDEFVVVAPGAGQREVADLAERARQALAQERLVSSRTGKAVAAPLGFSIGVASAPADGTGGEAVLQAADARLYQDKRRRRRAGGWLFVPRRVIYLALLVAAVLGLLVGSYVGARVETSVSAGAVRAQPGPSPPRDDRRVREMTALIADLERRLLEPLEAPASPAPSPIAIAGPTPDASPIATPRASQGPSQGETEQEAFLRHRIAELEAQIGRLQREVARRPAPPPAPSPRAMPSGSGGEAAARPRPGVAGTPSDRAALAAQPPPRTSPPPPAEVTAPVVLSEVKPRYPRIAQALRQEALVEVRVAIGEQGEVLRAELAGPPAGYGFDEAAREAALRTRFRPALRSARPVPSEAVLQYRFRLQ